jgi:glutathione peroxidase-family protein
MGNLKALFIILFSLVSPIDVFGNSKKSSKDSHPSCRLWAESGECDKNPNYMKAQCKNACDSVEKDRGTQSSLNDEIEHITSFYQMSAKNIDKRMFQFSQLRNKVVVVVNVASYCGYTESHYKGLVELYDTFEYTNQFEILAFPSNQFGEQEPDECPMIKRFAESKGVKFMMMDKIDVNGPNADIVYKFLKAKGGPSAINWNFATYYVIGPPGGSIRSYSGVEPMDLKGIIEGLMSSTEL